MHPCSNRFESLRNIVVPLHNYIASGHGYKNWIKNEYNSRKAFYEKISAQSGHILNHVWSRGTKKTVEGV